LNSRISSTWACPRQYRERMTSAFRIRDVRQHDFCPATNVRSSDAIGMTSAATLDPFKDRLRRSVGFRDVPALGALPACIARVHKQYGHSYPLRLVLDEGAQLPERPARELSALLPSSPHPLANILEIFKCYRTLRAFGKLNKLFADYVVGVGSKPLLFAGELLQATPRRVRAFLLKLFSESAVAVSDRVYCLARADVAVRVYRYVFDPEVHADDAFRDKRLRVLDFACGEQIKSPRRFTRGRSPRRESRATSSAARRRQTGCFVCPRRSRWKRMVRTGSRRGCGRRRR
jgi:hypothetical protein